MAYHKRPEPRKTASGKKVGRPRRIDQAVSCRWIRARVTVAEYEICKRLCDEGNYANPSELLRVVLRLRPPPVRTEVRDRPALLDREAVTTLRRTIGLVKKLLGVERSLADRGAVLGITREQQAKQWTQLIELNKSIHQLLERLA